MEYALKDILMGLCGKTYVGLNGDKYIPFGNLSSLEVNRTLSSNIKPTLRFKNLRTGKFEDFNLDEIAYFHRNSSELE